MGQENGFNQKINLGVNIYTLTEVRTTQNKIFKIKPKACPSIYLIQSNERGNFTLFR